MPLSLFLASEDGILENKMHFSEVHRHYPRLIRKSILLWKQCKYFISTATVITEDLPVINLNQLEQLVAEIYKLFPLKN